jgi:hypothetical protein
MSLSSAAQVLGPPSPRVPTTLQFSDSFTQTRWRRYHREVGSGWYWDGFLCLFGEGVERLDRCLTAWGPVVGKPRPRLVLGRNAYGAILVIDDVEKLDHPRLRILDPFETTWGGCTGEALMELFGKVIPNNEFPAFFSNRLYQGWREREGRTLGPDEILTPRVPEDAGGQWEINNLVVEDVFQFYERTAVEWSDTLTKAGRRKKKRTDQWL